MMTLNVCLFCLSVCLCSYVSEEFVIQSGTNFKLDHVTRDEYEVYFKAYDPEMPHMV